MAIKFKLSEKTDTWTLKGMDWQHVKVIAALLNHTRHTRLGNNLYENAAFELIQAIENDQGDIEFLMDGVEVDFYRDRKDGTTKHYGDEIEISLKDSCAW